MSIWPYRYILYSDYPDKGCLIFILLTAIQRLFDVSITDYLNSNIAVSLMETTN